MNETNRHDIEARYRTLLDSARWFSMERDEGARARVDLELDRLWTLVSSQRDGEVSKEIDSVEVGQ